MSPTPIIRMGLESMWFTVITLSALGQPGFSPGRERRPVDEGSCSDLIVVGSADQRHRDLPPSVPARSTYGLWVIYASFQLRARVALLTMEAEVDPRRRG
jgi:hypothetical protein